MAPFGSFAAAPHDWRTISAGIAAKERATVTRLGTSSENS